MTHLAARTGQNGGGGGPEPLLPLGHRWDAAGWMRGVKQSDFDGEERASEAQMEDPSFIDEVLLSQALFWPSLPARGR